MRFCREKTAAECPNVKLVRRSRSISTACDVLLKIAAVVVGEDNKCSDTLLKILFVAKKTAANTHFSCRKTSRCLAAMKSSQTRSPKSNPSSPKRESHHLPTPSQLCHFTFNTPVLLQKHTMPTFHPADRAGKREPRCG